MSSEPAPKVYLQNRLSRCRQKLQELEPVLRSKQVDVEKLRKLVPAYAQDHSLGNAEEVADVRLYKMCSKLTTRSLIALLRIFWRQIIS